MTTIVSDKRFIYADKRTTWELGAPMVNDVKKTVALTHDDSTKIYVPTPDKVWRATRGYKIRAIATSGCAYSGVKLIKWLDDGRSLRSLYDIGKLTESSVGFDSFTLAAIVENDNGETIGRGNINRDIVYMHYRPQTNKWDSYLVDNPFCTIGSGGDYFHDSLFLFSEPLTPFEAFVYGCYHDNSSSLVFDYYDLVTDKLYTDNRLSGRQIQRVLDSVQSKIRVYTGPKNK